MCDFKNISLNVNTVTCHFNLKNSHISRRISLKLKKRLRDLSEFCFDNKKKNVTFENKFDV